MPILRNIKDLKPDENSRFKQGYYTPKFPEKYLTDTKEIIWRSSWEYRLCVWMDTNPEVLEWASEPIEIKYFYNADCKYHRYYPDFYFATKKNGKIVKYIVECKPSNQLRMPTLPKRKTKNTVDNYNYLMECYQKNKCKKKFIEKWCDEHGYEFVYVTENSKLSYFIQS